VQLLSELETDDRRSRVMRGTIPPGVVIPLHSHADPETFFVLSGEVLGLADAEAVTWLRIGPGDIFHVPGGVKHGFRNRGSEPAVMLLISSANMYRFFREIGTPVRPGARLAGPPSAATMQRFLEVSERYGYWNASPEENARVGIAMPVA
jgi:quercetin dioxygenase-like cupin family protein